MGQHTLTIGKDGDRGLGAQWGCTGSHIPQLHGHWGKLMLGIQGMGTRCFINKAQNVTCSGLKMLFYCPSEKRNCPQSRRQTAGWRASTAASICKLGLCDSGSKWQWWGQAVCVHLPALPVPGFVLWADRFISLGLSFLT